jgi:hypothetical protein
MCGARVHDTAGAGIKLPFYPEPVIIYIYYITNLGSRMNSEDLGPYFPPAIL